MTMNQVQQIILGLPASGRWWRGRSWSSKRRFARNSTTWRGWWPQNIVLNSVAVNYFVNYERSSIFLRNYALLETVLLDDHENSTTG